MEIWGITGLMGTGKSTATRLLAEKGYPTLDVDQLTKLAVDRNTEMGKEGFAVIYRMFGETVLDRTGNLDRSALRKKIMVSPDDQERLQKAIDPIVLKHVEKTVNEWGKRGVDFGFIEGARLAEAGYHNLIKGIIQVAASSEKRINRLAKRDSMGKQEIEMMFKLQDREEIMRRIAKIQFKNDGSQAELSKQIDKFLTERKSKS